MFNTSSDNDIFYLNNECDMYVAKGLAFYSEMIKPNSGLSDYILTDVCPFSLGVKITDLKGTESFSVLINRNSTVPCRISRFYAPTTKLQYKVKLNIYQGESIDTNYNTHIGELSIPVTFGKSDDIKVTFEYDINSLLRVTAHNTDTNEKKEIFIHHNDSVTSKLITDFESINFDADNSKYYLERLEFIFENCHPNQRKIIEQYYLSYQNIVDSGSKIERLKFEKQLNKLFNNFEESYFKL